MDRWKYCAFFAYWVIIHALLSSADPPPPQKKMFFEKIRNNFRGSSGLDPDQALHFIGPDMGSNFLQMFSVDEDRSKMLCRLSGREI